MPDKRYRIIQDAWHNGEISVYKSKKKSSVKTEVSSGQQKCSNIDTIITISVSIGTFWCAVDTSVFYSEVINFNMHTGVCSLQFRRVLMMDVLLE